MNQSKQIKVEAGQMGGRTLKGFRAEKHPANN